MNSLYPAFQPTPILSVIMAKTRMRRSSKVRGESAARLLERAHRQPGVADLFKLYQRHAETLRKAEAYVQPRSRLVVYATSDATA